MFSLPASQMSVSVCRWSALIDPSGVPLEQDELLGPISYKQLVLYRDHIHLQRSYLLEGLGRKEMFYNYALNTFYLWLYSIGHM